jgi:hypothetical protein
MDSSFMVNAFQGLDYCMSQYFVLVVAEGTAEEQLEGIYSRQFWLSRNLNQASSSRTPAA